MLLQKVNSDSEKPGSGSLTKIALYIASLVAAYFIGYYEHSRMRPSAPDTTQVVPATVSAASPTDAAASGVPLSSPPEAAGTSTSGMTSSTPDVANETPAPRVERAIAVAPSASDTPAPSAAPAKQPNEVTITEPVEIPVIENGKTTGYINLQRGQVVTPIGVDHDQIKIRSGTTSLMVPIKSTDMAH